jgi:hypothetical protein
MYNSSKVSFESDIAHPIKALVKKAVIAEGTKMIYDFFIDYKNLCEVSLPEGVERMSCAFDKCPKLAPFALPDSIIELRGSIFNKVPKDIVLPKNLTELARESYPPYYNDKYPFSHSKVRSVVFPAGMTSIPSSSFSFCKDLKTVVIPEGVEEIGTSAFSHCSSLKSVTLPSTLKYISSYAFSDCAKLESIDLPEGCSFSDTAFYGSPVDKALQPLRLLGEEPTEYSTEMGEIADWDRIKATLTGKPLKDQFSHFALTEDSSLTTYSYGEEVGGSANSKSSPFPTSDVESLILREGVLVGVTVKGCTILAGETVCTYSADEDDGAGSRSVSEYFSLSFLS